MSDEQTKERLNDDQTAAVVGSLIVINFFLVYWALQFQAVQELLEMAYG